MKKITFLVVAILCSLPLLAQNFYEFSTRTAAYADLTNPTSLSNGKRWKTGNFGPITSPFTLSIFGQNFNTFSFEDDDFVLTRSIGPENEYVYLVPISAFIQDRNISGAGNGLSHISYKVEGTTGNRILKLEVKNAGLEREIEDFNISNLYLNFQIWLYEVDDSVEFHFGNHNITDINAVNYYSVFRSFIKYASTKSDIAAVVSGDVSNPSYGEFTDASQIVNFNAMPTPNTVYRFEVNPLAIKDQTKVLFNVYPNPTTDILNITVEENNNYEYVVYDAVGRFISSGKLLSESNTIDVSYLNSGIYYFKIGATVKKFIKK